MSYAGFERCLAVAELPQNDGQPLHDTPGDPGGATEYGLTFPTFAAWRAAHGQPSPSLQDFAVMTAAEREAIFHAWFWMPVAGDRMPVGLDLMLFDIGFLSGPARAVNALRQALGLELSGRMDSLAIGAAQAVGDVAGLISRVADAFENQAEHFGDAAEFERGWFRRVRADVGIALDWRGQASATT